MTRSDQRLYVEPESRLNGVITVPGDKSISHRAIILGSIANGRSTISGMLRAEDCLATMAAMRMLGVPIGESGQEVAIEGVGMHGLAAAAQPLDLGNSGTALRLLTGLLAGQHFDSILTGDESLRSRPMMRIAMPLEQMGADVSTTDGHPPVAVRGGRSLHGIDYEMPIASAQVLSAILLAGLFAAGRTTVKSPGIVRDHTQRMLADMGVPIEHDSHANATTLTPCGALAPLDLSIPGDFSSAAFFIVGACLGAPDGLVIENIGVNPTRTGLLRILERMGAEFELRNERVVGSEPVADISVRQSALRGIDISPELVPLAIDELPAVFVAAAAASGKTRIRGAAELRHKESDRLSVMAAALHTLGIDVIEYSDGLEIMGGALGGGRVDSCGDHRVAMSLAIASVAARSPIEILHTSQVATSFPAFEATAAGAGIRVNVVPGNGP